MKTKTPKAAKAITTKKTQTNPKPIAPTVILSVDPVSRQFLNEILPILGDDFEYWSWLQTDSALRSICEAVHNYLGVGDLTGAEDRKKIAEAQKAADKWKDRILPYDAATKPPAPSASAVVAIDAALYRRAQVAALIAGKTVDEWVSAAIVERGEQLINDDLPPPPGSHVIRLIATK